MLAKFKEGLERFQYPSQLLWQHNMCRNWPIIQWFTNLICINWQWHQHGTSKHKFRYNLFLGCNDLMGIGQPLKISYFVGLVVVVLNWIKQTHFESWLWQLSCSPQAVRRQPLDSKQTTLRKSSGSTQASSASPQAVLRQSPLLLWQHNMCRNWPII